MSDCRHPYNSLVARAEPGHYSTPTSVRAWEVVCTACKERFYHANEQRARDFILAMYQLETGNQDIVVTDLLGTPIEVGSHVIYPVLSGRSTAIAEGHILEIDPPTKGKDLPGSRLDAPRRLKVQPTGRTSRNWYGYKKYGTDGKPITLSANAESAVVIP